MLSLSAQGIPLSRLEMDLWPETEKTKKLSCFFPHKPIPKSEHTNPTFPAQEQEEANKCRRGELRVFLPVSGAEVVSATHRGVLDQGSSLRPLDFTLDFVSNPWKLLSFFFYFYLK